MSNCYTRLADKIELHLKLDHSPGYILTAEDQTTIIDALRFAGGPAADELQRLRASESKQP